MSNLFVLIIWCNICLERNRFNVFLIFQIESFFPSHKWISYSSFYVCNSRAAFSHGTLTNFTLGIFYISKQYQPVCQIIEVYIIIFSVRFSRKSFTIYRRRYLQYNKAELNSVLTISAVGTIHAHWAFINKYNTIKIWTYYSYTDTI